MDNIQEILSEILEQVQWHERYFSAICPFPHHGYKESHPSLLVYEDGFTCLGCKRSGKLEYLLKQVDKGHAYVETVKISKSNILPRWSRWNMHYGQKQLFSDVAHRNLLKVQGHDWWFRHRQIAQFIEQGYFGYMDGWAIFPVYDSNKKVIDIIARATKGKGGTKYVIRPDNDRQAPNIYVPNWNRVLASDTVYIVYGIVDSWAMEGLELPCITGTTGKSLSPVQLKPLDKKWIIVPDRYEEDAAYHLANLLGWKARVNRIKYPSECKDPDDIRMKLGQDALRQYIGV